MTTTTKPNSDHLGSLTSAGDVTSFPSHAELVRTLLGSGGYGTLTTTTESQHPYGSLVAFSVLTDGSPMACLSELAEHTKHARRSSRGGLFVSAPAHEGGDPMDTPRVSIVGELASYEPTRAEVELHLAHHPGASDYVDWNDFGWWRLAVASARYVGGFGTMSWVDGAAIAASEPDPVIPDAAPAIAHMNADHADANLAIARHLAGLTHATTARLREIDRYGLTLYADTPTGIVTARVAFDGRLDDPAQIRSAVVELTRRARSAGSAR